MEVEFLRDVGCCNLCIDIFRNLNLDPTLKDDASLIKNVGKKNRLSNCSSCLGILQFCTSEDVLNKLCRKLLEEDSDSHHFSLSISLPACLSIRIHSIWTHLLNKFPHFNSVPAREHHLGMLKDRWRTITGRILAERIGKKFVDSEVSNYTILLSVEYQNNEKECESLELLCPDLIDKRRLQHKKYNEGVFTRKVVIDLLKDVSDEEFLKLYPHPPAEPEVSVSLDDCQCTHVPLYIAGRYNKYSRELSQTPWLVEGCRRMESCVEELLSRHIEQNLRTECVFSSSGREDVDVRCLGNGRPFVFECLNPRKTKLSSEDMLDLQNEINRSTSLVSVRDLQLVTKQESSNMKIGEEEKTKSYSALCFCPSGTSNLNFSNVCEKKNFEIIQTTPLRVLHRRPLLNRSRMIHSMNIRVINEHFFKLFLETAAGTYIKEFVHGDFGRTHPNLGTILGSRVDIIALDVLNVKLDWPPQI